MQKAMKMKLAGQKQVVNAMSIQNECTYLCKR